VYWAAIKKKKKKKSEGTQKPPLKKNQEEVNGFVRLQPHRLRGGEKGAGGVKKTKRAGRLNKLVAQNVHCAAKKHKKGRCLTKKRGSLKKIRNHRREDKQKQKARLAAVKQGGRGWGVVWGVRRKKKKKTGTYAGSKGPGTAVRGKRSKEKVFLGRAWGPLNSTNIRKKRYRGNQKNCKRTPESHRFERKGGEGRRVFRGKTGGKGQRDGGGKGPLHEVHKARKARYSSWADGGNPGLIFRGELGRTRT